MLGSTDTGVVDSKGNNLSEITSFAACSLQLQRLIATNLSFLLLTAFQLSKYLRQLNQHHHISNNKTITSPTHQPRSSPSPSNNQHHTMSQPTPIFYCPSALITTAATYRTPKECMLWHFTRCLSDTTTTTTTCSSSSLTPVSSQTATPPLTPSTSPVRGDFLDRALEESKFVIQFEEWVGGMEREAERRWFVPCPYPYPATETETEREGELARKRESDFLQLQRDELKSRLGHGDGAISN